MAKSKGIYGLSGSGMDIDTMVKQMLTNYQSNYDKVYKQKVSQEWKKAAYNEFYKSMLTFQTSTLTDYKMQGTMSARSATSNKTDVVTAEANGAAATINHDIAVTRLAQKAYIQSNGIHRDNTSASTSIKLADIVSERPTIGTTTDPDGNIIPVYAADDDIALSFTISGNADDGVDKDGNNVNRTITYTYAQMEGKTLNDLASDINKLGLDVKASYDSVNDSFVLYNKNSGENNYVNISVDQSYYDADGNQQTTSSTVRNKTAELFNNLNLQTYRSGEEPHSLTFAPTTAGGDDYADLKVTGTSAKAMVDGREYTSDTNKLTVQGVTYTLNKLSEYTEATNGDTELVYDEYDNPVYKKNSAGDYLDSDGNITTDPAKYVQETRAKRIYDTARINVDVDEDKIVDNVKKFVEDYNKMIDSLNDKIYEVAYKDYQPLTTEEKSAMSEEEIKKWEEKAKSGLLYKDSILRNVVSDMRTALNRPVEGLTGKYISAGSIGISVTTNEEHGHIALDEEKLRKAIQEDPDSVYKIFATQGNASEITDEAVRKETEYERSGVANRLTTVMINNLKKVVAEAGMSDTNDDQSALGLRIDNLMLQMSKIANEMDRRESELYKQFNAMETAIASLNQQYNFVNNFTAS